MKKKKNSLKQMNTQQSNTAYGVVTTSPTVVTPIQQTKANLPTDLRNHGIILQKHSIIQKMYEQSGPNAKSNEFQMHYWMLIFRHTFEDNGFLDIAVPTCYFNYEQFVTSTHVDFEMKDVSELSEKLLPIHNMITNQILATNFQSELENIFGLKFDLLSVDVGTIHRHPGSSVSQRFSGTDLDANNTNHGIVFPLRSGENKPSFSGIMAVDAGTCNVAHYEYRLVNGSYSTNDMTYSKGRCLAITLNDTYTPPTLSSIQKFFGITQSEAPLKIKTDDSLVPSDKIQALNDIISLLPDPNIQLVRSENVKTKPVTTYKSGGYWLGGVYYPPTTIITAPYKLPLDVYDYPIVTLRMNLEKHLQYHNLPCDMKELEKLSKIELETKLKEVYEHKPKEDKKDDWTKVSKTDKDTISSILEFEVCPIKVYKEEELIELSKEKLVEHHDELDTYYYGKQGKSILVTEPDITKLELIDYIIELYINIYDEEEEAFNAHTKHSTTGTQSRFTYDYDEIWS